MSDVSYEVGRGKPPRHTRFKKGQSDNPAGLPKGSRNLRTEIMNELLSQVTAKENGRQIKISKGQAMMKSVIAKAAGGDMKAATLVFDLVLKLEASGPPQATAEGTETEFPPEDEAILADFAQRQRRGGAAASATPKACSHRCGPPPPARSTAPPTEE